MEAPSELLPLSGTDASKLSSSEKNKIKNNTKEEKIRRQNNNNGLINFLKTNALTFLTVLGVFSGIILGLILRNSREKSWNEREIMYINYLGELFLRMLKSLILPLIVASLISAIGSLDLSLSSKIGARAIVYYMTTTVSAVILGIILVSIIQPGLAQGNIEQTGEDDSRPTLTTDTLMDLVRNMFPPNLVGACISQTRTVLIDPKNQTIGNDLNQWKIIQEESSGMNVLGLVVFATVLGITLGKMKNEGKPLLDFFECLSSAMMIITNWVIWLSPVGVLFLVASKVIEMKSFKVILGQLGMYFMTVVIGLFFHGFIVLPLIYFLMTRKNPLIYLTNMGVPIAMAFGTSSSSATLPVAINCLETRNNIDPRVSRFVMPIGASINMDGTALYEAVAAIFIAQVRGKVLSFGNLAAISVTATAASIGAAGIPQAGLVTMVMVLDTVGLPSTDVTLIIAIDWLLDRMRTTINVIGDSLGAGIVNHMSKNELAALPHHGQIQNGAGDHHNTTSI